MRPTQKPIPKRALVVVDVQNDFISGSLALSKCPAGEDGEAVVPVINTLQKRHCFDLTVFTLDWHPENHCSFVNNVNQWCDNSVAQSKPGVYTTVCMAGGQSQTLWPSHCVANSWGAALHPDMVVMPEDVIVKKGVRPDLDSYSAFFDNAHRNQTELDRFVFTTMTLASFSLAINYSILKAADIEEVYVCGLATDICVRFTAEDSAGLGYKTYIIDDASRGVNPHDIEDTQLQLPKAGITFLALDDVLALA